MTHSELKNRLSRDLAAIGLDPSSVEISIRPYSKSYWGRYFPHAKPNPKVYLYPYSDRRGGTYPYDKILLVAVHEMCHDLQYRDGSFVRVRGVAHDADFWDKYNLYRKRAETVLEGGNARETVFTLETVPCVVV